MDKKQLTPEEIRELELQKLMFQNLLNDFSLFELFASIYEKYPQHVPSATRFALEAIFALGSE